MPRRPARGPRGPQHYDTPRTPPGGSSRHRALRRHPRCGRVRGRRRREEGDRARHRRHGSRNARGVHRRRPTSEFRPARRRGRLQPTRNDDATAQPSGLVYLHHWHGPGRPRCLRLPTPRPGDDATGGAVLHHRTRGLQPRARRLDVAAHGWRRRAVSARTGVVGAARCRRNRDDDLPDAGQLPTGRHRRSLVRRHGHAGFHRRARYLLVLHRLPP